jgi:hypothetical protein
LERLNSISKSTPISQVGSPFKRKSFSKYLKTLKRIKQSNQPNLTPRTPLPGKYEQKKPQTHRRTLTESIPFLKPPEKSNKNWNPARIPFQDEKDAHLNADLGDLLRSESTGRTEAKSDFKKTYTRYRRANTRQIYRFFNEVKSHSHSRKIDHTS